jgi:short-subunit dehydrogenase
MIEKMKSWKKKYGSWGLVAGAAEGLGRAFSMALAIRGMDVVLIDVEEDKLYETADYLEKQYGIRTKKLLLDLSVAENITTIFESMEGLDCRLIIYNAAYGPVKPFLENSEGELDYYIDLNSRMPLHLVFHFIKNLPQDSSAGIILVSSLAGLFGTNLVAPYGATKAFNYNLAEALYHEFRLKGIDILACCAGATDTTNYRNTLPRYGFIKPSVANPHKVAQSTLKKLGKTGVFIPGVGNRIIFSFLSRILTRRSAGYIMNKTMMDMYSYRFDKSLNKQNNE